MKYFTIGYWAVLLLFPGLTHAHPGFLDPNGGHACKTNCEKFGVAKGAYHKHTFSLKSPFSGQSEGQKAPSMKNNRKKFDPDYESGIVMDMVENEDNQYPIDNIGIVKHIIDGDTLMVQLEQGEVELSLYGIAAPELEQNFGPDTALALKNTLLGKRVSLLELDFSHIDKARAVIILDDININHEMVKLGYAWVYVKGCRQDFCDNWIIDQVRAQKNKTGLWQNPEPLAPWKWQAQQMKEKEIF